MKKYFLAICLFLFFFAISLSENEKKYSDYIPGQFSEKNDYISHWIYLNEKVIPLPYLSTSKSIELIQPIILKNILDKQQQKDMSNAILLKLNKFHKALNKGGLRALSINIGGDDICFIGKGTDSSSNNALNELYFYHELEHCYVRSQPNGYTLDYYWGQNNPLLDPKIIPFLPSNSDDFNRFAKIYTRFIDESFADVASLIGNYQRNKDISVFDLMAMKRQDGLCSKMDYGHWSVGYINKAKHLVLNNDLESVYHNNYRAMAFDIVTSQGDGIVTPVEYYNLLLNLKKKLNKVTFFC